MSASPVPPAIAELPPSTWLVTGVAGFIGSHLLEALLLAGQDVVGLDDFSTGTRRNLDDVRRSVGAAWSRFRLVEGDLRSASDCAAALDGVDYVLHQAALNSVPRSVRQPTLITEVNVGGSVQLLDSAMRRGGVRRVVCASSSSVYGDTPAVVRREDDLGTLLSPYAASKRAVELYCDAFSSVSGISTVCLRYFNVLGRRQNQEGPYSAVIPRWTRHLLAGERPELHGDGTQSRDFTDVRNVVRANLLAAIAPGARGPVNVATGRSTELSRVYRLVRREVAAALDDPSLLAVEPRRTPRRAGDVHSAEGDLTRARDVLGYQPLVSLEEGLPDAIRWFAGDRAVSG
jgi:UDP-N-acetylglucosamine 4-epimerase